MSTEPTKVVIVHPDDVNLADTKALAAQHGATIIGNRYCPRGSMLVIDPTALRPWQR